ncbi:MAG: polysaccharide deacetylase family protein [Desulfuromonadales bacterium]|nr:polysaccharide deacetylase family protein [Desulfuromonadales bacterium]
MTNSRLQLLGLLFGAILLVTDAAADANIFVYHRFGDPRYPSTNVSLDNFRQHLEILRDRRATVLRLGELVDLLTDGRQIPPQTVVLTVDDAYRTFLTGAVPLLREFGYPATLFVNTDAVGGGDYLSWADLRQLRDAGIEIGNHSARHDSLLRRVDRESEAQWRQRVADDLQRARAALQSELDLTADLFAYPYGEYSTALTALVRQSGFRAALGQQSGVVSAGSDLWRLPRFPMAGPYAAPDDFRGKLMMKALPVTVLEPTDTLVTGTDRPPRLRVRVDMRDLEPQSLRCYVSGQGEVAVNAVAGETGLFEVQAKAPLTGRRAKYTLTARGGNGGDWYWFSQLWIFPER